MDYSSRYSKQGPFIRLLTPSAMGVVFYTFLAALIIILNQFSSIEQYLQVPANFQITHTVFNWLDKILTRVIGENSTAALVVGLFWAVVGLLVYVSLRGIAHFISDVSEGYEARGFMLPQGVSRNQYVREAFTRNAFRVIAVIGLIIVLFGPLAAVMRGPVLTKLVGSGFTATLIVWFIACWLVLHCIVVLLRLVVLKPRLFG